MQFNSPSPHWCPENLGLDPSCLLSLGTEVFCGMALLSPKSLCLHGTLSSALSCFPGPCSI